MSNVFILKIREYNLLKWMSLLLFFLLDIPSSCIKGESIPNNGQLQIDSITFQFGPLAGELKNTILLDDTPTSLPPDSVKINLHNERYSRLVILYTGVGLLNAKPGKIQIEYRSDPSPVLSEWELLDWTITTPSKARIALTKVDWFRTDRGFEFGEKNSNIFFQSFPVDGSREIQNVTISVKGNGSQGDAGIFALSGCLVGSAIAKPINLNNYFNYDTIFNSKEESLYKGFRYDSKPQYFATENASRIFAAKASNNKYADPYEIYRSNPDFIIYDPTGGERRLWQDVPKWNEHLLVQETKDGQLLAMWTSGTKIVGYSRSKNGGSTWTKAKFFPDSAAWQVPIIAPSGRIYLVYTHGGFGGGFAWRLSDDHGRTWSDPLELTFAKTTIDNPQPGTNPKWISCTVPHFDKKGRPIIAYTLWAGRKGLPGGTGPAGHCEIHLMRLENLAKNPSLNELKINWLNQDRPITVPNPDTEGASFAQEPYIVDLPDDRMFMVMRTNRSEIWYTTSNDQGQTWRKTEPLRYRDNGRIIKNPVCPCPVFRLHHGDYVLLFNNNDGYVYGARSRWAQPNRRPAYICRGEFQPNAHQPIWWSDPPLLLIDNAGKSFRDRLEAAPYVSLTEHKGRRVLWYPDRKAFLLGKIIPDLWLDQLKITK